MPFTGFLAVENSTRIHAGLTIGIRETDPVAHQATGDDEFAKMIHRGHRVPRRKRDQLVAAGVEERTGCDRDRGHTLLADLRILHANAAAETMLSAGHSLSSHGGVLTVRPAAVGMGLAAAVRHADDELSIGRRGFGIPLPRPAGKPCMLHVLPLRHGVLRPGLAPSAAAAVFVAPAVSKTPPPKETLGALFDLTASKARVFELIAGGVTQCGRPPSK